MNLCNMNSDENQRNNVNFLMKAARLLPNENFAHKLLKSYYLTKCKKLVHSSPDQTKAALNEEEMCRKCSSPWYDTNYSFSIAPIKVTKRKALKLQKKIDGRSKRKGPLVKQISKKVNNIMTVKCGLCSSKNKVILYKKSLNESKQQKIDAIRVSQQNEVLPVPPQQSSSKKKRKKDKNAGLTYSLSNSAPLKKDEGKATKKIINLCEQTKTMHIQKKPIISTIQNQTKNTQNHQNGNKNKVNKNQAAKGPKVKSKNISQAPPKRNNLLLLANALKAKSAPSSSSQTDKLKKMLR